MDEEPTWYRLYQSFGFQPRELSNGAMVLMDSDGLFWACDSEDADLLPAQGPARTVFVLTDLMMQAAAVTGGS
jgi:hypothetical protein